MQNRFGKPPHQNFIITGFIWNQWLNTSRFQISSSITSHFDTNHQYTVTSNQYPVTNHQSPVTSIQSPINQQPMNPNYLKSLRIVYFALAMGIVFFMFVSLLLNSINGPLSATILSPTQRAPFLITLILITGVIFMAYKIIIPKKLEVIKTLPTLDKKLAAWRDLYILQGALIEAPAFFATVLFLLLGISVLLIWPLAGVFSFWLSQPTRDKLISDANLSPEEAAELDKME